MAVTAKGQATRQDRRKKFDFAQSIAGIIESSPPAQNNDVETVVEQQPEIIVENKSEIIPEKKAEPKPKSTKSEPKRKYNKKSNSIISLLDENDSLDDVLSQKRSDHGVQKSVYFNSDIYQYIQGKADKNGIKFSVAVNIILREAILKHN